MPEAAVDRPLCQPRGHRRAVGADRGRGSGNPGAGCWSGQDILIFFATLIPFGFGVTIGFTPTLQPTVAFKTSRADAPALALLGSMALEGPVIEWVAYHRRHHRFSDVEGDPHSPHVAHGDGVGGAIRGLFYAHVGWVLFSDESAEEEKYAPDLIADPVVLFVDRTFILWAIAVWRCRSASAWR